MKKTIKKQYRCKNCHEIIESDDAGYGYPFKKGQRIFCKKSYGNNYHLHYHNEDQMEQAILETARGTQDRGRTIRSYGVETSVVFE